MIAADKQDEYEKELALTEYLASFWNSEAVQKVRDARKSRENHAFKSDEEFERSIISEEYKNNPLLEAVRKLKQMEQDDYQSNNINVKDKRKVKGPTNLAELSRIMKKF